MFQQAEVKHFPPKWPRQLKHAGFISYVTPADGFSKLHVMIKGLPVSNWDHAVNGGVVTDDGRLLWAMGASTNAGKEG